MIQLFQNLRTGEPETLNIPTPQCSKGCLLIQSHCSLISPGTERMLADFGKAGWISKARQQPEKVKQVLQKMRTDGVEATVKAVFSKLDQPLPVGYSNVGTVLEIGEGVKGYKVGDRILSNGYHSELVVVPENLTAKIPDGVSDEEASFTVLGAIALQGVRLAEPTLGETFVVYGLGLIGLLTCQLLSANGCKVIGIDLSEERAAKAREFGVHALALRPKEDPIEAVLKMNRGNEVDGVLITANTSSNEPIQASPFMTRKRGRIVLVGNIGLQLERNEFFQKEISFRVSCSYGPGRYDEGYEKEGLDYPIGFVRWTEQRNFEAILELLRAKKLDISSLISERIRFDQAVEAYDRILTNGTGYGFIFNYDQPKSISRPRIELVSNKQVKTSDAPVIGFIGAGNYTRSVLLPAFQKASASFSGIVSNSGMGSADLARKFSFQFHATDVEELLSDASTTAVAITTRHNSHADLVKQALKAGKHVFVEKPLCMSCEELEEIRKLHEASNDLLLMVGFNRRYSPLGRLLKKQLEKRTAPISFRMLVNAGAIPGSHWTQDVQVGGGRLVGEGCHFIDFAHYLTDSPVVDVNAVVLSGEGSSDTLSITLSFEDGSIGSIDYFANGHKGMPKERIEVFSSGRILQLENFLRLNAFGFSGFKGKKLFSQDKGQVSEAKLFLNMLSGKTGDIIVNPEEVTRSGFESMETTFRVVECLSGKKAN